MPWRDRSPGDNLTQPTTTAELSSFQVSEVVEKNREEEQRLRKDKTRMESTLNATIAKYDEDMASRTKTLQVHPLPFPPYISIL